MFTHFDPHPADTNQLRPVHPQGRNCRSANWRKGNELRPIVIPGEMIFPLLLVRMKKEHLLKYSPGRGGFLVITQRVSGTRFDNVKLIDLS